MENNNIENQNYEYVKCNFCAGQDYKFLFEGYDYKYNKSQKFMVVQCQKCGLVYLNHRPKQVIDYYPERIEEESRDFFSFLNLKEYKVVQKIKKTGAILDVGCGNGHFLFDMKVRGWQVYGNDLSDSGCFLARKKLGPQGNIYNSDIANIEIPKNKMDVVTLWHTIEHMKDPKAVLQKAHDLLNDEGVLIIETPNFANWQFKLFRAECYSLDLPKHLYFFTPSTLSNFLDATGFKIYKKDYFVNPRVNFVSLKYSLFFWLGLSGVSGNLQDRGKVIIKLRKTPVILKALSWLFNFTILAISLITPEVCFRVYCKKKN